MLVGKVIVLKSIVNVIKLMLYVQIYVSVLTAIIRMKAILHINILTTNHSTNNNSSSNMIIYVIIIIIIIIIFIIFIIII